MLPSSVRIQFILFVFVGFPLAAIEMSPGKPPRPAPSTATAQAILAKAPTPRSLLAVVESAIAANRAADWSACDCDGDQRPSGIEALASLVGNHGWWKRFAPETFKRCDRNNDGLVDHSELTTIATRETEFAIQIRPRVRSLNPIAAPGGIGAGIAIGGRSGPTASAFFGRQQAYIAGYRVVGGNYEPIIGVLTYGTALEVGDVSITIVRRP
ncbi:MAG: hypothetical protein AAB263_20070 [Planctomycetota bacterium]